ncbi:hypothetical protein PFLUV_G00000980 [Xyrichtys novacula]|uniref:Uncharacterized protein n=1 Tax=Xyrichtys novacula TaxID=13765 RepID=A0AAV1EZG2_XYRNO|nr:hypothetical protein PFLUV_G00000980 [Xyrichtys novacula]
MKEGGGGGQLAAIKTQRSALQPERHVRLKPEGDVCDGASVSQGDATEKLAHQVAAQIAAADRRVEEASGDPHEEEKDEAHKSSKGHVSEPAAGCPTSPDVLSVRICSLEMEEDENKKDPCVGYLSQKRTKNQEPRNPVTPEDEPQRSRPPD